jgi:hypothetical protein
VEKKKVSHENPEFSENTEATLRQVLLEALHKMDTPVLNCNPIKSDDLAVLFLVSLIAIPINAGLMFQSPNG